MTSVILFFLAMTTISNNSLAMNCAIVMDKPPEVLRFFDYVMNEAQTPHDLNEFSTMKWLHAYLTETGQPTDDIAFLDVCLQGKTSVRPQVCQASFEKIIEELYFMMQELRDAQACAFTLLPGSMQTTIALKTDKVEEFLHRLADEYHQMEWDRAMQRAHKRSQQN